MANKKQDRCATAKRIPFNQPTTTVIITKTHRERTEIREVETLCSISFHHLRHHLLFVIFLVSLHLINLYDRLFGWFLSALKTTNIKEHRRTNRDDELLHQRCGDEPEHEE